MKRRKAIANIKNPVGRRLLLIPAFIIGLIFSLVVLIYSVFSAVWVGLKATGSDFYYNCNKIVGILKDGWIYAWMGHEAYNAKLTEVQQERLNRILKRQVV